MSGGTAPYTVSLLSGSGRIDGEKLVFTPDAGGDIKLRVHDSVGISKDLTAKAYVERKGLLTESETWEGYVRLTGDVTIADGTTITIAPGTEVVFHGDGHDRDKNDGSNSFGRGLTLQVGSEYNQNAALEVQGTPSNPVKWSTATGFPNGRLIALTAPKKLSLEFVAFENVGDAATPAISTMTSDANAGVFILNNSTFTGCGQIKATALGGMIVITGNTLRSPLATTEIQIPDGGGTSIVKLADNVATRRIEVHAREATVIDNVIVGPQASLLVRGAESKVEGNIVIRDATDSDGSAVELSADDLEFTDNFVRGGTWNLATLGRPQGGTFAGNVFEGSNANSDSSPSSSVTAAAGGNTPFEKMALVFGAPSGSVWKNNVFLGHAGQGAFVLVDQTGIIVRNNVFNLSGGAGLFLNHGRADSPTENQIASVRNNIFIGTSAGLHDAAAGENTITFSDFNLFWNVADNYSRILIRGKGERLSPGFGARDLGAASVANAQLNPKLVDASFRSIPYSIGSFLARTRKASDVLSLVKDKLKPAAASSPVVGTADPMDKAEGINDIGAFPF